MKKIILSLLVVFIIPIALIGQTLPQNFDWGTSAATDQKVDGPCHLFAAAAAVEDWYKILYGPTINLSEKHLYSPCAGASPPSTTIDDALTFFKNYGVVNEAWIPYLPSTPNTGCSTTGASEGYYAEKITSNWVIDCGTPYQNCDGITLPSERYRVANFARLDISAMANTDQLKRELINKGPIPLWFVNNTLHPGRNHAYLLTGYIGSTWILKDSWPGAATISHLGIDLVALFKQNSDYEAWYITKTTPNDPKNAVYKQVRSANGVWSDAPATLTCFSTTSAVPFTLKPNAPTITSIPNVFKVVGPNNLNLSLLDNPTVEWSYEPYPNGSVTMQINGNDATITAATSGTVNIIAKIKTPNGICRQVKKSYTVSAPTPFTFTFTKVSETCIGSGKRVIYKVTSSTPNLQYVWKYYPSPPNLNTTSGNGTSQFTIDIASLPTSYGVTVEITSPSGYKDGYTTGGYVASCSSSGRIASGNKKMEIPGEPETISIFPNPATNQLNVTLPVNSKYSIQLISALKGIVIEQSAEESIEINTSKLDRGVYIIRLIPHDPGLPAEVKKFVLE